MLPSLRVDVKWVGTGPWLALPVASADHHRSVMRGLAPFDDPRQTVESYLKYQISLAGRTNLCADSRLRVLNVRIPDKGGRYGLQEAGHRGGACRRREDSDQLLFAAPDSGSNSPSLINFPATESDGSISNPSVVAGPAGGTGANPTQEAAWASALVGQTLSVIQKNEAPDAGIGLGADDKSGTYPGPTGWAYAVVKPDNFFTLYRNTSVGGNNLVTDLFSNGISHITWLTPLPAAAWLFLSALVGLFGVRWWRSRAGEAVPA